MSKLSVEGFASGGSNELSNEAEELEKQLIVRRQRLRTAAHDLNRKVAAKMTSPGMLLAAVGVGVALEQTSHHRASHDRNWSIISLLNAANSCIQLFLSFTSNTPSAVDGLTESAE